MKELLLSGKHREENQKEIDSLAKQKDILIKESLFTKNLWHYFFENLPLHSCVATCITNTVCSDTILEQMHKNIS